MTHKLTRLLALTLAVVMTVSMLLVPVEAASFRDVADGSWYAAAVEYVNDRGWMAGVSETSFAPNAEVTRGMMVTVLARLAGAETDNDTAAFADTAAGRWYTGAAAWAAEQGIVAGIGGGKFAPNRAITRQDLCTMLYAYIEAMGIELDDTIDRSFMDSNSVADYARTGVNYCAGTGLISGFNDGSFGARKTANRAQLAQILMRLDLLIQEKEKPEEPKPAQSFEEAAGEDMTVAVEAPEGALPEASEMIVTRITDDSVLATLKAKTRANVFAIADISFAKNGAELEPEEKVEVEIAFDDIDLIDNPAVVHMKDNGSIEWVDSELIATRGAKKTLRFSASDFSIYAIIDGEHPDSRVKVQFMEPEYNSTGGYELVEGYSVYITKHDVDNTDGPIVEGQPTAINYLPTIVFDPPTNSEPTGNYAFFGWTFNQNYTDNDAETLTDGEHTIEYVQNELYKYLCGETSDIPNDVDFAEGDVIYVYPVVYHFYTLSYLDELGEATLQTQAIYTRASSYTTRVNYTSYDPYHAGYELTGWLRMDKNTTLQNGDSITISQTTALRAVVVKGVWINFIEAPKAESASASEYKGARYQAPVFCPDNEVPILTGADAPYSALPGYEFIGWFEKYTPASGGTPESWEDEFDFSQPHTLPEGAEGLTLYAKFVRNTEADVTVILWTQNVNNLKDATDDGDEATNMKKTYDYVLSEKRTNQTVGDATSTIDVSAYLGHDGKTNVTINGEALSFRGFHYKTTTYSSTEIQPDGSTIINVYYDRDICTVNFYGWQRLTNDTNAYNTVGTISTTAGSSMTDGVLGFAFTKASDGSLSGTPITYSNYSNSRYYFYTYSYSDGTDHNTTHYAHIGNVMYTLRYNSTEGAWQYRKNNEWINVKSTNELMTRNSSTIYYGSSSYDDWGYPEYWKSFEGLYGQDYDVYGYEFPLKDQFGDSARWYYDWLSPRHFASAVKSFEGDMDFYAAETVYSPVAKHYLENTDKNGWLEPIDDPGKTGDGWRYEPYTGFTGYEYRICSGTSSATYYLYNTRTGTYSSSSYTTQRASDGKYYSQWVEASSNNYIVPDKTHTTMYLFSGGMELHYTRNTYNLTYFYGAFRDGDTKPVSMPQYEGQEFQQIADVPYQKRLTDYENSVTATSPAEGYVFTGWFKDQACTDPFVFSDETMDVGGKRVYAQFTKIQYRVFLDANLTADETLYEWPKEDGEEIVLWNNRTQSKNFRVDYNGLVSNGVEINGEREGYALVGWYLDEDLTVPFNFAVSITPATMDDGQGGSYLLPYNQNTDYTDPGNSNSDKNNGRVWIEKKLILYAKWRKVIEGAKGIHVVYDANYDETDNAYHGRISEEETWIEDERVYSDGALVITRGASIPDSEDWQFSHWEIMRADPDHPDDPTKIIPTGQTVHPGGDFNIDKDYAVVVDHTAGSGDSGSALPVELTSATVGSGKPQVVTQDSVLGNLNPVKATTNDCFTGNFETGSFTERTRTGANLATSGWTTYNAGSGNNWTRYNSSTNAHGGNYAARYYYSSSNSANCYLISEPFDINLNTTALNLSMWHVTGSYTETYEAYLISASGVTTVANALSAAKYYGLSSSSFTNTSYQQRSNAVSNASALAGQSARLVIHCTSAANQFYLYVDDVVVTETIQDGFTVSFRDYDGSAFSNSAFDDQSVANGGYATEPSVTPTREGYTFVCWRRNGTYSNKHNFTADAITTNTTLTACYAKNVGTEDVWVPYNETTIDTSKEYLIGVKVGSEVFLVENYNVYAPSPYYIGVNYGTSSGTAYMAYMATATLSGDNVVGAIFDNNAGSTPIDLSYCTWKFSDGTGGTIQSALESGRYLAMYSETSDGTTKYYSDVRTSSTTFTYSNSAKTLTANGGYGTSVAISLNDQTHFAHGSRAFRMVTSAPSTSIQLYAKQETRTVTFNANGGTGSMEPQTVVVGEQTNLNLNTFTREGYNFIGWNTAANGSGTDYANGAPITLNSADSNLTLYAQWLDSSSVIYKLVSKPVNDVNYIVVSTATISSGAGYALSGTSVTGSGSQNYLKGVQVEISSDDLIVLSNSASANLIWIPNGDETNGYLWKHNATGQYLGENANEYLALVSNTNFHWLYGSQREFNNQVDSEGYYYLTYTASGNGQTNYYTVGKSAEAINLYAPAHTLTVNYVMSDGSQAPAAHIELMAQGTATTVITPAVEGYTADQSSVSWTMGAEDHTVTVTYTKDQVTPVGDQTWYQTHVIDTNAPYLIGYEDDNGHVYLLMNYNPNPLNVWDATNYYVDTTSYLAYGVEAEVDQYGNVVGIKNDVYADASFDYVKWHFLGNGQFYRIRSDYQDTYYLRSNIETYTDCYPVESDSYGNWTYDAANDTLGYYVNSSTTKYMSFVPLSIDVANLFESKPTADGYSRIKLYSTAPQYTVTFVDPMNNNEVLKVETVPEGSNAHAPTNIPVYVGYLFTGWDKSYENVTQNLTVSAQYQKVDPFTVTFMGYDEPMVVYVEANATVNRPGTDPVSPDGYEFKEWRLSGVRFDFSTPITSDIILYPSFVVPEDVTYTVYLRAVYEEKEPETYTHVTWYADNETRYHQDSVDVILNTALPILDPTSFVEFEKAGYVFYGWANLNEPAADADDLEHIVDEQTGKVIYYEIPEEEADDWVWLKLNPASGAEHPTPYFTVKVPTRDGATRDVVVSHIAANENRPYNGLYAIWKARDTFYVVHSATGKMEAVKMEGYADGSKEGSTGNTLNLVDKVTPGYLYGGYYKAYGGSDIGEMKDLTKSYDTKLIQGEPWVDAPAGSWYERSYELTENEDMFFECYDGKSSNIPDTTVKFFTRANAYNPTLHANECKGDALKPVAGEIYYIKEVPSFYLQNKIVYSMNYHDNMKIIDVYQLTVVDDALYNYIGFDVDGEQQTGITYARSFTIDSLNWNDPITVTPHSIYNEIPEGMGYLCIKQLTIDEQFMDTHFVDDHIGSAYNVTPKWSTIDGVGQTNHAGTYIIANDDLSISYMEIVGRTFEEGEKIYVNMRPDSVNWWMNDSVYDGGSTKFMAFLCIENTVNGETTTASAWVELKPVQGEDTIYSIDVPAGVWQKMVLLRVHKDCPEEYYWDRTGSDHLYNQTGDIGIPMTGNYLTNFYQRTWKSNGEMDQNGNGGVWSTR